MSNFSFRRIKKAFRELCWDDLPDKEQTYDRFISLVYNCLDELIRNIEENCMLRIADSEDRLNDEIKMGLRQKNLFDAVEHDAQCGGHIDLLVRLDEYMWKGEAKIFGGRSGYGNDWLYKGFHTLSTKYSKGNPNDCHGGVLIYIKAPGTKSVMEAWQAYLLDKSKNSPVCTPCTSNPCAFFSEHPHIVSGLPYKVRHIPISIYDPTKPIESH